MEKEPPISVLSFPSSDGVFFDISNMEKRLYRNIRIQIIKKKIGHEAEANTIGIKDGTYIFFAG